MAPETPLRDKLNAIHRAGRFRPLYAVGIVALSVVAAILEGIGLSFILPIIELAQGGDPGAATGALAVFVGVYRLVGVPFNLAYLVLGVAGVMTVRYTSSFLVGWLQASIEAEYVRHIQVTAFEYALDADVAYFDQEGSDEILNAIVTQAEYAGRVIRRLIEFIQQSLLSTMYLLVALYFAPTLTLVTVTFLGAVTFVFRRLLEGGYSVGDRVADANERIQEAAQAGTQGIREVKLFGMIPELYSKLDAATEQFASSYVKLHRNEQALRNFYQLITAVTLFALIYVALTFASISLGALGVFLFAMFRLGPRVSNLNQMFYTIEGTLPHLVRTQAFVRELRARAEPDGDGTEVPDEIRRISFEDVEYSYESSNEQVLRDVSFSIEKGEFVAFVGPSGAGKSTIAALLARLYVPDSGRITANDVPITEFDLRAWRSRVSLVRQNPYVFNDTLRRNVTAGDRDASPEDIHEACEIAQVTEFLERLPDGYDTVLGDDGVRLSGGQRQRVAIARALLKDSELLVLDEATSDLDTSLEKRVHAGIESLDCDVAMVVIAHRLSTVTNADRIYTLQDGRIVEVGTHEELMERSGEYAGLYTQQTT